MIPARDLVIWKAGNDMGELDKLIEERYISQKEAADICGVAAQSLSKWCREGYMGAKVGGRYIIDRKDLDQFVKTRGNPNFKSDAYQQKLATDRRNKRISSQEAEEALQRAAEAPQEPVEEKAGGIMMGRRRR